MLEEDTTPKLTLAWEYLNRDHTFNRSVIFRTRIPPWPNLDDRGSVLLAGHGVIAAPLPETAGVGSLTPIAKVADTSFKSDELLSAFLELEQTLL